MRFRILLTNYNFEDLMNMFGNEESNYITFTLVVLVFDQVVSINNKNSNQKIVDSNIKWDILSHKQ